MTRHIEQAASFVIGVCDDPKCQSIHIELLDHDKQSFATMVVRHERIPDLIETLKNCTYRIVALK